MTRLARRPERGAAAVEFALVMPILLVLVFGLIQYGLYFWALQAGSDIARGAARVAATGNLETCGEFETDVEGDVDQFSGASSAGIVTRTYAKAEGNTSTDVQPGDRVTVTVEFNAIDLNFPFVPFIDEGQVSQAAEARVDYVPTQPVKVCP